MLGTREVNAQLPLWIPVWASQHNLLGTTMLRAEWRKRRMLTAGSRVARARAWAQFLSAMRPSARCLTFLRRVYLFKSYSRQTWCPLTSAVAAWEAQASTHGQEGFKYLRRCSTPQSKLICSQLSLTGSCLTPSVFWTPMWYGEAISSMLLRSFKNSFSAHSTTAPFYQVICFHS